MRDDLRARRPEPHTTPETMGMPCDGCASLSCIRVDGARLHPWRYYCEDRRATMTLAEMCKVNCEKARKR